MAGESHDSPCVVSYLRLLAVPEKFDGRWVKVRAYYPGFGVRAIFPTSTQFQYQDQSSSLILENNPGLQYVGGYVEIIGRFRFFQGDIENAHGMYRQFGILEENFAPLPIESVAERYSRCEKEGCRIEFAGGLTLLIVDD